MYKLYSDIRQYHGRCGGKNEKSEDGEECSQMLSLVCEMDAASMNSQSSGQLLKFCLKFGTLRIYQELEKMPKGHITSRAISNQATRVGEIIFLSVLSTLKQTLCSNFPLMAIQVTLLESSGTWGKKTSGVRGFVVEKTGSSEKWEEIIDDQSNEKLGYYEINGICS